MIRVAIYARYSTDQQNPTSVEDQFRVCQECADREPWKVVGKYSDSAISGATVILRPGIQELMRDAHLSKFDIVLAEALDRLTRSQADAASLYEQLCFLGVQIVTLAEGEIDELKIGFKGTMNAVFLKDLKGKVHRGLLGRVMKGKAGGGLSYGYNVVRSSVLDARGKPIRGDREINNHQAEIVRRVLREYADGDSPSVIAERLNNEGITGPFGRKWLESAIRGDVRRGTGLINNELYIGKLVWHRCSYVKNPATGKDVVRIHPPEERTTVAVPELRIVEDELWEAVKRKQAELRDKYAKNIAGIRAHHAARALALNATHRPRHFLDGLLVCRSCDGRYIIRGGDSYGCSNHLTRKSCSNKRTVRRQVIEAAVLAGLRGPLLDPKVAGAAIRAYVDETDRLNREWLSTHDADRKMLTDIQKKRREITFAIENGDRSRSLRARLLELEAQEDEIQERLSRAPMPVQISPNIADIFREKVKRLAEALQRPEEFREACAIIRGLIDHITLTPGSKRGEIAATLYGDLGAILAWTADNHEADIAPAMSASVASGKGNHRSRHFVCFEIPNIGSFDEHGLTDTEAAGVEALLPSSRVRSPTRILNAILQQAVMAGVLSTALLGDPGRAIEAAERIVERLNKLASGREHLWDGQVVSGVGLVFSRTRQGIDETYLIDAALLRSTASSGGGIPAFGIV